MRACMHSGDPNHTPPSPNPWLSSHTSYGSVTFSITIRTCACFSGGGSSVPYYLNTEKPGIIFIIWRLFETQIFAELYQNETIFLTNVYEENRLVLNPSVLNTSGVYPIHTYIYTHLHTYTYIHICACADIYFTPCYTPINTYVLWVNVYRRVCKCM